MAQQSYYKVQLCSCIVVNCSIMCSAHSVTYYYVSQSIICILNVSPHPLSKPNVRCTVHGRFYVRLLCLFFHLIPLNCVCCAQCAYTISRSSTVSLDNISSYHCTNIFFFLLLCYYIEFRPPSLYHLHKCDCPQQNQSYCMRWASIWDLS